MATYLRALGNLNNSQRLWEALQGALAAGLLRDGHVFSHAIHSLQRMGREEEAAELWRRMREQGVRADVVLYTNVVQGCLGQEDGLERAEAIFRDMCASGIAPDMEFYSKFIQVAMRDGAVNRALELLHEAEGRGLTPCHRTWFQIVGEATRLGRGDVLEWAVPLAAQTKAPGSPPYRPPPAAALPDAMATWGEDDEGYGEEMDRL